MPKPLTLRQQIVWILVPTLLYGVLFLLRPFLISPYCATHPTLCTPDSVNALDHYAYFHGYVMADFASNIVQNGVALITLLAPFLIFGLNRIALRITLALLSISAINAMFMEGVRALVQRPRPVVLSAPLTEGLNINHYTSFYSGHTSFVALATLFTWLWIRKIKNQNHGIRFSQMALIAYPVCTISTGILRVIGGRHYPTDVLGGIFFGSAIGWIWSDYFLNRIDFQTPSSPSI